MASEQFTGLTAAVCSPFDSMGLLNTSCIPEYAGRLQKAGIKNVFVCGTTGIHQVVCYVSVIDGRPGESLSLTLEERKLLAETWKQAIGLLNAVAKLM